MPKINIKEKFSLFDEVWIPKIIAEFNGQLVKIVKGSGNRIWHKHDNEDELFIVFKGKLILQLRDKNIELNEGEMYVVPKGVEHCPFAAPDTHFMRIESASAVHTGKLVHDTTVAVSNQHWI